MADQSTAAICTQLGHDGIKLLSLLDIRTTNEFIIYLDGMKGDIWQMNIKTLNQKIHLDKMKVNLVKDNRFFCIIFLSIACVI